MRSICRFYLYLSIHPSIYLVICWSYLTYLSIHPSGYLPRDLICCYLLILSVHPIIHPIIYLLVWLGISSGLIYLLVLVYLSINQLGMINLRFDQSFHEFSFCWFLNDCKIKILQLYTVFMKLFRLFNSLPQSLTLNFTQSMIVNCDFTLFKISSSMLSQSI